ncbi:MFS transporter [Pseudomonas sp. PCH446]
MRRQPGAAAVRCHGLLWFDRLEPLHLYIFNCMASIVSAFRKPAYQAAVNSIVARINSPGLGLMGISKNASALVAPLLAGAIMARAGFVPILAVDLITFCSGTLLVIKAFSHVRPAPGALKRSARARCCAVR